MSGFRTKSYSAANVRGGDEIVVGGIDVETDGLGGELLMVQWGIMGEVKTYSGPQMVEVLIDQISRYPSPVIWYTHFAQYDWRYFMGELARRERDGQIKGLKIHMRSDVAAYQITFKNAKGKKIIMRDSFALWPGDLASLAKAFCPELPKLEIDVANFDPANPEHVNYAKRDVEILLVALPRLFALLHKHFGIQPNGTTASTALKAWQSRIPEGTYHSGSKYNAREIYIRSAYYGGLVFLTDTNPVENCITFDRRSSYPAVMMKYGVPSGTVYQTKEFQDDKMAIYTARVKAPDDLIIPILPARNEKGAMRWFRGEFVTTCTNRELVFAANNGYQILEIIEGIAWEETIFPFNEVIGLCKQIREAYPGKSEETLAKLLQNALYGKFGTRRERLKVFSEFSATDEDFEGAKPWGADGTWYVKSEFDDQALCKPEWAVFITAHARLELLRTAYSCGPENVIYGDTDSVTVKAGFEHGIDEGQDYGQWNREKEWKVFRAIAPKVYSGIKKDGTRIAAVKGLPKSKIAGKAKKDYTEEQKRELLEYGNARATVLSLDSLRLSLKRGVQPARELSRVSSSITHSVNFERLPNGKVRPKIAA